MSYEREAKWETEIRRADVAQAVDKLMDDLRNEVPWGDRRETMRLELERVVLDWLEGRR